MLFVERVRAHQRAPVQEPQVHRAHAWPDIAADHVVQRIAGDRRDDQQHPHHDGINMPRRAERAGNEQQGIARQEGQDDQPRFRKHNQEQHQQPGSR
ncbi:hypothetical protein G6F57_023191 [Rhizopus arrhizus]|nr:hypothetical protein G6F57_023191 [Rhizopus arrhizus]